MKTNTESYGCNGPIPLLVRLRRPPKTETPPVNIPYDVVTDTAHVAGKSSSSWIAATGTSITKANTDPTQDEQTDR